MRNPNRANNNSTARSRRPTAVPTSQPATIACTCADVRPRGRPAPRQPATVGTAPTNDAGINPATCKYRNNDRNPVTIAFADHVLRPRQYRSMNPATSWADRPANAGTTGEDSCVRNILASNR